MNSPRFGCNSGAAGGKKDGQEFTGRELPETNYGFSVADRLKNFVGLNADWVIGAGNGAIE
jgi:hypothetical protein